MNRLKYLMADLPEDVNRTVFYGDFKKALKLIDIYLERNISKMLRDRLIFEKDRIRRLKEDYVHNYDNAFEMTRKEIKDLTKEEFEYLMDQRYIDWIYIDGKPMFHRPFLRNTLRINMDMRHRFVNPIEDKSIKLLDDVIAKTMEKGKASYLIHAKAGVKLREEHARPGEKIKIHLPIPRKSEQIENIKILKTSHQAKYISSEEHPQRSIYFEEVVNKDDEFTVEYSFESHIKYNNPKPENVVKCQPTFYTEEFEPHIRFTPYLRELAEMIIGDETNPLIIARKIYDYITKNVQYTYVRQYGAITNIPEYAAYNLKGDCGVQALLFITLCRIAKIPAKWQSGLIIEPEFIGNHDWAQFYVEPYGWMFADLSYGGAAYRLGSMTRWNYYFGNIDPFRMVANSEFHYDLYPEKKFLRIDPYDNQDGELEYMDRPVLSHEFQTIKKIIEVKEI